MTENPPEVLRCFYQILVEEFRSRPPWDLSAQFYLSDLYNNLVPFELWGERLGLETEAEYDHVLLRLLAGEGDYLRLGSEKIRREMEAELTASNPILGVYRDFAATRIRLNPERTEEILASEEILPSRGAEASDADPVENLPDGGEVSPGPREEAPTRAGNEAEMVLSSGACNWCACSLPNRAHVNFCPFCGKSVRVIPCPTCREPLEQEWRFCISCGTQARPAAGEGGRDPGNPVVELYRSG